MDASVYRKREELYKGWTTIRNTISENDNISFEDHMVLTEKEEKIYKRWLFYDKLLKRMEVASSGNKKKKCNKKANSTYKRRKTTTSI